MIGIDAPGPAWCAWHQAPFRFFPQPAITPELVRAGLLQRCNDAVTRRGLSLDIVERYDWQVVCAAPSWELRLDGLAGEFEVGDPNDEVDVDGCWGFPSELVEKLDDERPRFLTKESLTQVQALAYDLWLLGDAQLKAALRRGLAVIKARPGNRLAPFSSIPREVLSAFDLQLRNVEAQVEFDDFDDRIWDASARSGEHLFSIFVAPAGAGPSSGIKISRGAERRCQRWLTELMRKSPHEKHTTRAALVREALERFEGLSKEGFGRAFRASVDDTGADGWSRPGRPKRKSLGSKSPD